MPKPTKFQCSLHVRIRTDQILDSLEESIQFHDCYDVRAELPEDITSGELSGDAYAKGLPPPSGPFSINVYYKICKFRTYAVAEVSQLFQKGRVEFMLGHESDSDNST